MNLLHKRINNYTNHFVAICIIVLDQIQSINSFKSEIKAE